MPALDWLNREDAFRIAARMPTRRWRKVICSCRATTSNLGVALQLDTAIGSAL
jgi:hypothetical protein